MKHDKTFEAIAKLQDIEIELRRLKTALEITNKALDAAVLAERNACVQVVEAIERNGAWVTKEEAAAAIRARGSP